MGKIYSEEFKRVLLHSRNEAMKSGHKVIHLEHFILGMTLEPDNDAHEILLRYVTDIQHLRNRMTERLRVYGTADGPFVMPNGAVNLDRESGDALQLCVAEATNTNSTEVMSSHLLLAMIRRRDLFVADTLAEYGLVYDSLSDVLRSKYTVDDVEEPANLDEDDDTDLEEYDEPQSPRTATQSPKGKTQGTRALQFLAKYGHDLTRQAMKGELDPVVGRKIEIERLTQILTRRKKNNPILIGEAGVGKTAIVEGLAQRIVEGSVPILLQDKRIIALDMASVVAGTKFRGQFEERLQGIVRELNEHPEVILFIDEIHTIIGAGSAQGTMDAANMLKPALSRGKVQCIGATTVDEYRKSIEKDSALERRFQKVNVNPATIEESIEILTNIKGKYEQHHNVSYTDGAIEMCVKLTERYIADRKLPDKAIDALDEAGSRKHLHETVMPDNLKKLEQEMARQKSDQMAAVESQDYETASKIRDSLAELKETFTAQKTQWLLELRDTPAVVDEKDVEQVVSVMSGVPVHKMAHAENVKLKELKQDLSRTIIAQDKAITKLVKAITRNRIGLRDPNKPIGTFLFLGPTGVGKTFLARKLAEYMFGTEEALIRIDMSEYMEKFSTSRLVGAPPGYVGYEEGGQLTEKVRRRPYSIILLDEIEKANKDVYNILLQVMDEGRLTDNNGVTVDFRNTIIILTSNCGSRDLQDFGSSVGFNMHTEQEAKQYADSIIMKSLNKQFAPEFINRIDDIILFDQLNREAIGQIIDNELDKLNLRMTAMGYTLEIDDKAKAFLVDKSYDRKYGARPLKRAIQTYVEDGISDYILGENVKDNGDGVIHITKKDEIEELVFG